ncbi:MAG: subclass B3 metallo-beta-lactamase [Arenimonas sp.]|uniref:subclass B3 metallo-beta-lactamase n=1 Tax=Arenimonas sp. TaxID=1872635 RepID=UPI0025BC87F8|nr:subclass B3 metallo-beta-lactamase [Arenimonas sp.]MBW8366588.1 subclass B3 metallo-beta-lactamase [Arenimonas sp.]
MLIASALLATVLAATPADLTPIECKACPGWNKPRAPFLLHGRSWYVGTEGLSAVLVDTGDGLVLIDGALPQSAPLIAANVRSLGFALEDVRWILNSHPHYDHAGGIAALQRMSGARVASTARGAQALKLGNAPHDDPQVGYGPQANAFPPVAEVTVLADGDTLALGTVTLTMHATPGHTPGGSTWTWRSCDAGDCRDLVYADSITAVSAPGFRFSDDAARTAEFRATLARMGALDCDLVVSAHPGPPRLFEKAAARDAGADEPAFFDSQSCRDYAAFGSQWLDQRLAEEATRTD